MVLILDRCSLWSISLLHRMVILKVLLVLLLVCSPVKSISVDHYDGMSNRICFYPCVKMNWITMLPYFLTTDLIRMYFHLGKPYYVIASYLCLYHGLKRRWAWITIIKAVLLLTWFENICSISWLKRRLSFLGLRRKQNESHPSILQACLAIIVSKMTLFRIYDMFLCFTHSWIT